MMYTSVFRQSAVTASIVSLLLISATSMVQANAVLPIPEESPSLPLQTYEPNTYEPNIEQNTTNTMQTFQYSEQSNNQFDKPLNIEPDLNTGYAQLPNQNVIINEGAILPSDMYTTNIADDSQSLKQEVFAYVVAFDATGQEQLIPVTSTTRVNSGDILEYQTKLTNTTADYIRSMTVSVTIPDEVELIGNIMPEYALGSLDGSNFQYMPLTAQINGVLQDLPLSYYKSVGWDLNELNLNETTMVSYRARFK